MILGQYSVTELKDLLKAKDGEMADLANAVKGFSSTWQSKDRDGFNKWTTDYNNLKSRYGTATIEAKAEIVAGEMVPFVNDDNIPAQTGYSAVIDALQKTPGTITPGYDFQDIFNRIQAAQVASGQPAYVESPVAQPTKGSDTDLNVYQAADSAIKTGEKGAKQVASSPWSKGLLIGSISLMVLAGVTAIKSLNPLR